LIIAKPYLLFLGDSVRDAAAKTGFGLKDWCPDDCVGQWPLPAGGRIEQAWIQSLIEALQEGLDIVSGMHRRLADVPNLHSIAERCGRQLIDVRHGRAPFQSPAG
jgi:hypothetical protein